jgi:hypothetical protein
MHQNLQLCVGLRQVSTCSCMWMQEPMNSSCSSSSKNRRLYHHTSDLLFTAIVIHGDSTCEYQISSFMHDITCSTSTGGHKFIYFTNINSHLKFQCNFWQFLTLADFHRKPFNLVVHLYHTPTAIPWNHNFTENSCQLFERFLREGLTDTANQVWCCSANQSIFTEVSVTFSMPYLITIQRQWPKFQVPISAGPTA